MAEALVPPPFPRIPPAPPASSRSDGRELARGLKWSVIAHLAILTLVLLKGLVFPGSPRPYVPTLRVDLVGLPDALKQELKNVPKEPSREDLREKLREAQDEAQNVKVKKIPPAPPVERADPDELVMKPKPASPRERPREDRMKSALDRIRSLEKIRSQLSEQSRAAAPPIKGNRVSKGTSLSGDARESAEAGYYDLVRDALQNNWALPVWLARQKFTAQVQVFIDSRGRVRASVFVRPSGNSQFDDAVRKTLQQSQPFPVPPIEIRPTLAADGILVGFPL